MLTVHFVSSLVLVCLGALVCFEHRPVSAIIKVPTPEALEKLFAFGGANVDKQKLLEPMDLLLEDVLPAWFNQAPNNENGTRPELKPFAMRDDSNDDAHRLTGQELLTRSGFKYEVFDAIAEDGYITQLTHMINPRADRTQLRQPPLLMEHGGTIDPTAYLLASSIQHFPEPWPRKPEDGPMRSWNRSLAFMLANHGFDVWLAETRGSNDNNRRHISTPAAANLIRGRLNVTNHTMVEQVKEVIQTLNFWAFSQDDIIAHELKSHMDTVLKLTGSTKLNLMTFSLSTPTSLAFLGRNPAYAKKVHGFISMAPIVSGNGTSRFVDLFFKTLCPLVPDEIGTLLLTDIVFTQPFREFLVLISKDKDIRYMLFKSVTSILMGASPKWQTLLELNLIGHLFRQLSFREFKQMCQQMSSNRLQMYDYGPIQNQIIYKQIKPPLYDISQLHISDWIVVAGSNDALATPKVIEQLISIVNPKPSEVIVAPNFNHLDLFAGWENDIYVNKPIMRYLERKSYIPRDRSGYARSLDLSKFLPEVLQPNTMIGQAQNMTKQFLPLNPLDPKDLMESLAKSLKIIVENFAGNLGKKLIPKLPILGKPNESSATNSSENNYQDENRPSQPKTPMEKVMSGLKLPGVGGSGGGTPPLFDPKKMIGNFGQMLGKLGRPQSSPLAGGGGGGGLFGSLAGYGRPDKRGEQADEKPTNGDEVGKGIDQVGAALVGLGGAVKAANSAAKVLSPDAKLDSPAETLKNLADAAAGVEAVKNLASSAGVLG